MAVALDPNGYFSYVLHEEREAENPTRWRLRFLRAREFDAVKAKIPAREEDIPMSLVEDVLAMGLHGWSGFLTEDGAEVSFPGVVSRTLFDIEAVAAPAEAIARIGSMRTRVELMSAIMTGQKLTVAAAKKSKSPHP